MVKPATHDSVSTYVSKADKTKLRVMAAEQGVSVAAFVAELIVKEIKRKERRK